MARGHRNKNPRARQSTSPFHHNRAAAANRNYERFAQAPQQPAPQPSCFQENLEATHQKPEKTVPKTRGPSSERHGKQERISKSRSRSQSPQRPVSRQASERHDYRQDAQPSSNPAGNEMRSAYRSRSPQRRSSSPSPPVAQAVIPNHIEHGGVNNPIVIDDDEDDMPPVNEARASATPKTVRQYSPDDQQIGIPNAQHLSPEREASAEARVHAASHVLVARSPSAIPGRNATPTPPPPQRHVQSPPHQVHPAQTSPQYHHVSPVARSPAPVPSPHAAQTPPPPPLQYHRDAAPVDRPPAPTPSPPPQLHNGEQALPPLLIPKNLAQLGPTHRDEQALPPLSPHHAVHNALEPPRAQPAAADGPQQGYGDAVPVDHEGAPLTESHPLLRKEFHQFPPWVWETFYKYNVVMLNKRQLMNLPVAKFYAINRTNFCLRQLREMGIMDIYQLANHPVMRGLAPAQNNWQPAENWQPGDRGQAVMGPAARPNLQPIGGQPADRGQAIVEPAARPDLQLIEWQPADREQAAVDPAAQPDLQPIGGQPADRGQTVVEPATRPDLQLIGWQPAGVDPAARRRRIVDPDGQLDWEPIVDAAIQYVRDNFPEEELSGAEPWLWKMNYQENFRQNLLAHMSRGRAHWEAGTKTNALFRHRAAEALERSRRTDYFGNPLPVNPAQQPMVEAGLKNERDEKNKRNSAVPNFYGYPQRMWNEKYDEYFKEHCQRMDCRQARLAAIVSANTELRDMALQVLGEYTDYMRERELEDPRYRQLVTPYHTTRGNNLVVVDFF